MHITSFHCKSLHQLNWADLVHLKEYILFFCVSIDRNAYVAKHLDQKSSGTHLAVETVCAVWSFFNPFFEASLLCTRLSKGQCVYQISERRITLENPLQTADYYKVGVNWFVMGGEIGENSQIAGRGSKKGKRKKNDLQSTCIVMREEINGLKEVQRKQASCHCYHHGKTMYLCSAPQVFSL